MGGLGLVGVWLFLVVVIAVSILLAVGSIWLAHHSKLADSAGREENSALSPFLTCGPGFRRSTRIHRRRRLGAVLQRRDACR